MSKTLLLDTAVVNHAAATKGDEPKKLAFKAYLEGLFKEYEPAISSIVRFEAFAGSDHKTALKVKEFVDNLRAYDADKLVLDVAAVLASCYRKHEAVKSHASAISLPDMVIGATAFLTQDGYVLTTDMNDFPRPFFTEVARDAVTYTQENGRQHTVQVYVLKPNPQAYNECFRQCYPKGYNKVDEQASSEQRSHNNKRTIPQSPKKSVAQDKA